MAPWLVLSIISAMASEMLRYDPRRISPLVFFVNCLDASLRRLYGIEEFTQDPTCLLRIAMKCAAKAVTLSDGTEVRRGDVVGELHLWNAHLPRFTSTGPTLGWARRAHRLMVHSLTLLADHVQRQPTWRQVEAFYADAPTSAKRPVATIERAAARYGFEGVTQRRTIWRMAHEVLESLLLWLLAHAYNPAALRRQAFLRRRQQIWISRSTLIRLYGPIVPADVKVTQPSDRSADK
jgi:hypothetical protein